MVDLYVCDNMYVVYMSILSVCVVCMTVYLPIFSAFIFNPPFWVGAEEIVCQKSKVKEWLSSL